MKNIVSVSILAAALSWSTTASATLIDRGNGMIYDSAQNLTWLQDTNYAKTSGYDDDGLMGWDAAMAWATNLTYGGYDDWRLPALDVQTTSMPGMGDLVFISGSEIWPVLSDPSCPPPIVISPGATILICAPWPPYFTNINSTPFWYSVEAGEAAWAGMAPLSLTPTTLHPKSDQLQAWAVREGDVAAIPEPQSLALVALGLAFLGFGMRKPLQLQSGLH